LFDANNVKAQVFQSFVNVLSGGIGLEVSYYCFNRLLGFGEKGIVCEAVVEVGFEGFKIRHAFRNDSGSNI
jgi:hypothetical protein